MILQCKKEASRNLKKFDEPEKEASAIRTKSKSPVQRRSLSSSRTVGITWDDAIDKKVISIDNQDIGKVHIFIPCTLLEKNLPFFHNNIS